MLCVLFLILKGDLDQINAWIYETYREQPWSSVHHDWREGFLRSWI